MNELMWLGIVFGAIFVLTFTLLYWANVQREKVRNRLQSDSALDDGESSTNLLLGKLTPALAMPIEGEKRTELQSELHQAGFYRSTALMEYAAIRTVLIVLPLIVFGVLALMVPNESTMQMVIIGVVLAALGYSIPRVYINSKARARKREIEKALPVGVDLLALGLMSGQNIYAALRRVSLELKPNFPVLSQELDIARRQAEMNTLPHALSQMAERVQMPEVKNLVIILNQSSRQGTDIAAALMEFSNNFRTSMRQEADRRANQASFWMVFPSIFFLWVPAFAVLMAPVAFEFKAKREQATEIQKDTASKMNKNKTTDDLTRSLSAEMPPE